MSRRTSDASPNQPGFTDRPVAGAVGTPPPEDDQPVSNEGSSTAIPLTRPETAPTDSTRTRPATSKADPETGAERLATLSERLRKLEVRNRLLTIGLLAALVTAGAGVFDKLPGSGVVVKQNLMESKELTLVDGDGQPRLFLRMFSRVPVLQVMDSTGKPRMSLGLRFDDTPFIDLSDASGTTRATLEMTESDTPALRLFDEGGKVKFQIN